jgi:hypothetical protein
MPEGSAFDTNPSPSYECLFSDFCSAGADCSCAGFVARGGANGGGNPTNAKKTRIGRRQ